MFRALLFLIGFLVVMSVIRSVLGIVAKAYNEFSSASSPRAGTSGSRPPQPVPSGGELKKDPVCGTFISTATALQKSAGGQTYYFCSPECRDKFKG